MSKRIYCMIIVNNSYKEKILKEIVINHKLKAINHNIILQQWSASEKLIVENLSWKYWKKMIINPKHCLIIITVK